MLIYLEKVEEKVEKWWAEDIKDFPSTNVMKVNIGTNSVLMEYQLCSFFKNFEITSQTKGINFQSDYYNQYLFWSVESYYEW